VQSDGDSEENRAVLDIGETSLPDWPSVVDRCVRPRRASAEPPVLDWKNHGPEPETRLNVPEPNRSPIATIAVPSGLM